MTAAEQATFTAKRKEAYLALHPETGHGATGRGGKKDCTLQSFSADTASKTGQNQATVSRHASRGEKITPAALGLVRGSALDTGAFLDRLKRVKPDNQHDYAQRELDKLKKPKRKPARAIHVARRQMNALHTHKAGLRPTCSLSSARLRSTTTLIDRLGPVSEVDTRNLKGCK